MYTYGDSRSGSSWGLRAVVGLGVAAGLAVTFVLISPRVSNKSPAAGAGGISSLSPVTVTFSQPMDAASAHGRIRFVPATAGDFETSADGATLRFVPRQAWPNGTIVTVSIASGARSRLGLPMLTSQSWQFTVGEPRVVYLSDAGGLANVWALQPSAAGEDAQVTNVPYGVLDFDPSPDGTRLAYAAVRADGGSDLRTVGIDGSGDSLLLDCPGQICRAPQWSLAGNRLAFERLPLSAGSTGQEPSGNSHVWLLDLVSLETKLLEPSQDTTSTPRWSPDGARLAYYDPAAGQIVVYDVATGATTRIADASGEMGAWTGDGLSLIFPEIVFTSESPAVSTPPPQAPAADASAFHSHLIRVEVETRDPHELSLEPFVEDAAATPAPDGSWIAFGRKYLDAARWTPGRQLWLMRPDGSDVHPLTTAGDFQHSAFAWSPDGGRLVYTRFDLATPGARPEIWTMNADGTDARLRVEGGYAPVWLP